MIEVKSYQDLTVWPKSMDAAVSIPANIVEGKGRNHYGSVNMKTPLIWNYVCTWYFWEVAHTSQNCSTLVYVPDNIEL